VSLSSKKLPCLTCNGCNIQLFARSDRSDELVRALIRPAASQDAPKPIDAAIPSTPVLAPAVRPAAPVAAPVAAPSIPPNPAPAKSRLGLFQSW
jgi:hypothetical protein